MSGEEASGRARAVCAGCGCLCDDLLLDASARERGRPHVDTDCRLGRDWFASRIFGRAVDVRPPTVGGEEVSLDRATRSAGELLRSARHPLVTGLERLALAGQRKMVEVADRLGADLDPNAPGERPPSTPLAIHRVGGPFVTLAEMRERARCLVLWFVLPRRSHPRLLERFWPDGGDGGRERTLVAVGPRAEETEADVAVSAEPEQALRLLWLLRLLAEDPEAPERREDPLGSRAVELMEHLRAADGGAWLYGGGADGGHRPGPVETTGILELLGRLNDDAPWGARPLGGGDNAAGAEAVMTWQTGYPGATTFRDGYPRYDGTVSGRDRATVDAVLLAGGHPDALALPRRPPCVWLDDGAPVEGIDGGAGEEPEVAVRIPVLPPGAAEGDTLLRMDGLPVRSPGVPGVGERGGTAADEVLEGVLRELISAEAEEAGP